jgi:hypothetical protein
MFGSTSILPQIVELDVDCSPGSEDEKDYRKDEKA